MRLYDYYRSTASYRVRIVLNIKNINYQSVPINLLNNGQDSDDYRQLNPQGLVPLLDTNQHLVTQSLAIIEYLEERFPMPSILPNEPFVRAHVRSLAMLIACDMHPLNNVRVLKYLREQFAIDETQINLWYHHWLQLGFDAFEHKLQSATMSSNNNFCYGNSITLADICLIPQVYNAKRFGFAMDEYPLINAINQYCLTLPVFHSASPESVVG